MAFIYHPNGNSPPSIPLAFPPAKVGGSSTPPAGPNRCLTALAPRTASRDVCSLSLLRAFSFQAPSPSTRASHFNIVTETQLAYHNLQMFKLYNWRSSDIPKTSNTIETVNIPTYCQVPRAPSHILTATLLARYPLLAPDMRVRFPEVNTLYILYINLRSSVQASFTQHTCLGIILSYCAYQQFTPLYRSIVFQ